MFDLDELYKITCEEYYSYLNDTYGPDYEGGSTEESQLKFDEDKNLMYNIYTK